MPIALVLEHQKDPLSVLETVRGLVALIRQVPAVGLLCSDVSALGALAFGASWAAVGVRTSLRHLYPADGGFCSCGAPQVDTTRPRSPDSELSDREFTVTARIIQATEVQTKMKTMAAIRNSMIRE